MSDYELPKSDSIMLCQVGSYTIRLVKAANIEREGKVEWFIQLQPVLYSALDYFQARVLSAVMTIAAEEALRLTQNHGTRTDS